MAGTPNPMKAKDFWKQFWGNVKSHLRQIPYICWWPIATILHVFFGAIKRLYSGVRDTFSYQDYIDERMRKLVSTAISDVLHTQTNLMHSFNSRGIAQIFTFLLQFISALTTYAGFTFFLGTVNPFAPLFMAVTVQGLAYYLMNNVSSRKRAGGWKRIVLLAVLIIISSTTSYIGIFDGMVKPAVEMQKQYVSYQAAVHSEIISTANFTKANLEEAKRKIEDAIAKTNDEINAKQTVIAETPTTKVLQNAWVDNEGNQHANPVTVDDPDKLLEIAKLNGEIKRLEGPKAWLENYVITFDAKTIEEEGKKVIESNKESIAANKIIDDFNAALGKLSDLDGSQETKNLISLLNVYRASNLAQHELPDFDVMMKSEKGKEAAPKSWIEKTLDWIDRTMGSLNQLIVSKDLTKAEDIREAMNSAMKESFDQLPDDIARNVKAIYEQSQAENPQIMPFTSLKNPKHRGTAIFSLLIALSVDLLSVFIAFALLNKHRSILYFRKVGDLRPHREEMMEDCLLYICLSRLSGSEAKEGGTEMKDGKFSRYVRKSEIMDSVVHILNESMRSFVEKMHYLYLWGELNAFAYFTPEDIRSFERR